MDISFLTHLAMASGGILYAMVILLLVAVTVIIDRFWFLRRALRGGEVITRAISTMHHLDRAILKQMADASRGSIHGRLLNVPLQFEEVRDPDRLAELLEEEIRREAPLVDKRLWMLDTIVTLAPLLGLLGTIIGMFNTFQVLGDSSSAPTQVTGGVGEALVATASGLTIAVIGLVCFNALNNSVRLVVHQMETLKLMLVNRLFSPRRPQVAPVPPVRRAMES
jgi:biopolymer transport protein ExbB